MSTHIIDDRDPAVVYSAGWSQGGSGKEYNSTTTYTDSAGRNATLTFQGISVGVYGTIGSSNGGRPPPRTSYAIDGTTLSIYEPTLGSTAQQHARFFQSGELSDGKHQLVISTLRDNVDIYILDYFIVETSASSATPGSDATQTSSSNSHPVRTPIIVGCTVGAVVLVVLIIGILFFYLRRRKRNEPEPDNYTSFWVNPLPIPAPNQPIVPVMPSHKGTTPSHSFTSLPNPGSSHRYSVAPPQYSPPQYEFESSTTGPSSSAGYASTSTQNAASPSKRALAQGDFVVRNDDNFRTSAS